MTELFETLKAMENEYTHKLNKGDYTEEEQQECGAENFGDEFNNNLLDYDFRIDARKNLVGARFFVTLGGPTVWIDTESGTLSGSWGAGKESVLLSGELRDFMEDYASLLFECC